MERQPTGPADLSSNEPKYLSLSNGIRDQIESGELKPGDRLPTFVEMRAKFGVTPTTVERVYSLLEQEGLIQRERGRGTFVSRPDNRPPTNVIGICGVSHEEYPHPFAMHLEAGFRQAAREAGMDLLLLNDDSPVKWEKMDGVVIHETRPRQVASLLQRLPAGMPCVATLQAIRNMVSVVTDEFNAASDLVAHLADLGHQRIGCLFDPLSPQRMAGYQHGLRQAGLDTNPRLSRYLQYPAGEPVWDYPNLGGEMVRQWLQADWNELQPTALLTQNDDTAIGVIRALQEAGIRVPQDVSVTGFDGTEISRYFSPSLTTVKVPLREVGSTSIHLLLRQIRREEAPVATLALPAPVVIGESTANAPSK